MTMKKYIPRIGERVRAVKNIPGSHAPLGKIGIIKSINSKLEEIWVDFTDGSGGLYSKVLPHDEDIYTFWKTILITYKAGELDLVDALNELQEKWRIL